MPAGVDPAVVDVEPLPGALQTTQQRLVAVEPGRQARSQRPLRKRQRGPPRHRRRPT
jgi:hypothetical protein